MQVAISELVVQYLMKNKRSVRTTPFTMLDDFATSRRTPLRTRHQLTKKSAETKRLTMTVHCLCNSCGENIYSELHDEDNDDVQHWENTTMKRDRR